jgi:adenosylcobinamide kinase/adenosylcobinamide-phosphate guanylyltransferase
MPSTFILGGARSGKSRRALQLAESLNTQRAFIATAEPLDDEMKARILRHKSERNLGWDTIEAPLKLVEALSRDDVPDKVCVVDCLTLWLSNLMHHDRDVDLETERLCAHLNEHTGSIILVSNEVGLGLVPETPLGRAFRDAQGRLNQRVADVCDTVEFVAAGLPIKLKG